MKFSNFKKTENGQILIESLVSISMAMVALLGVITLLTNSIGINKSIGREHTAVYLAAEGIEVVKSLIDDNYMDDCAWNGRGLGTGKYELSYKTEINVETCNESFNGPWRNVSGFGEARNLRVNPKGFYGYDSSWPKTPFKRFVSINFEDVNGQGDARMLIKSHVRWNKKGGGTERIVLEAHYYNWRPN
ncbi:MAG: hypothetical protein ABEI53_00590 [Candidatus Magasanikbacteria bacterium]